MGWRSDFIILFMSYLVYFLFIFIIIFFIFYPFNMYKVKTSVTTKATVNYEIHVNVSVKRHICDVKICD